MATSYDNRELGSGAGFTFEKTRDLIFRKSRLNQEQSLRVAKVVAEFYEAELGEAKEREREELPAIAGIRKMLPDSDFENALLDSTDNKWVHFSFSIEEAKQLRSLIHNASLLSSQVELESSLTAARAASEEAAEYRKRYGCLACSEDHPRECDCPPHEVRTSGLDWFHERIDKATERATAAEAELKQAKRELVELRGSYQVALEAQAGAEAERDEESEHLVKWTQFYEKQLELMRQRATTAEAAIDRLKGLLRGLRECSDPNWIIWKQRIDAALEEGK